MERCLARFRRSQDGAIAVEFALLVPVMIVILFGSYEVTRLVRASIRATNAAQTIADLVAQQSTVTTAAMINFCKGGQIVMIPYPADALVASATSVTNRNGTRKADWQDTSCGNGGTITDAVSLGAGYTPNTNDSVIVVRVTYSYTPVLTTVLTGPFTMTRYGFSRPRGGASVVHS